jgi:cell division protein FtsX
MRVLKLALYAIRRQSAFVALVIFSLIVSTLLLNASRGLELWTRPALERVQSDQVVTLYLKPQTKADRLQKIEDEIRQNLGAYSIHVERSDSARFLSDLKKEDPEIAQQLESMGADWAQFIPQFITLSGVVPESFIQKLSLSEEFYKIDTSRNRYAVVSEAFKTVLRLNRFVMIMMGLGVVVGFWFLGNALLKGHQQTARWMELLGASWLERYSPVLYSMALCALLGSVGATLLWSSVREKFSWGLAQLIPILETSNYPAVWTDWLPVLFTLLISQFVGLGVLWMGHKSSV